MKIKVSPLGSPAMDHIRRLARAEGYTGREGMAEFAEKEFGARLVCNKSEYISKIVINDDNPNCTILGLLG